MDLVLSTDPAAAAWLLRPSDPWEQVATFGPPVFPAYARVRFIPDPTSSGQSESSVSLSETHPSDLAQVQRAVSVLTRYTRTPDDGRFCLWEGYSDSPLPPGMPDDALVHLPHRSYALLRGPLAGIERWGAVVGSHGVAQPPAFVWPADHAWCLARDVDPHWAGVGGTVDAIEALLADALLDAVRADPAAAQPAYR